MLPDGTTIKLGEERYLATEILFEDHEFGELSLQELISHCIKYRDFELSKEFYKNIVLTGGASLFSGISERLQTELKKNCSKEINVIAPSDRIGSQWIGGLLISSMSSFQSKWITNEQYDEYGPAIVHQSCDNSVEINHQKCRTNFLSPQITKMMKNSNLTDFNF
jgi:actin-related protein